MSFPKNFMFGGATSAIQCEGAYNEGGRGLTRMDIMSAGSLTQPRYVTYIDRDGNPGKLDGLFAPLPKGAKGACLDGYTYPMQTGIDFYHRYKEDIALMAEMGFKIFRMSISWCRLYPNGDECEPNVEGVEFYRNVFKECKKYNIEPLVTLLHGDTPLYLECEYDGWNNRQLIDFYVRYVTTCFKEYKGLVKYWLTFNEINNIVMMADMFGQKADDKTFQSGYQQLHYQFVASAKAVQIAHEIDSNNMVGCMICGIPFYPATCDPDDILLNRYTWEKGILYSGDVMCKGEYPSYSKRLWKEHNVHLDITGQDLDILKKGTVDMYTFSYYMTNNVTTHEATDLVGGNMSAGVRNPYLTYSEWGWA